MSPHRLLTRDTPRDHDVGVERDRGYDPALHALQKALGWGAGRECHDDLVSLLERPAWAPPLDDQGSGDGVCPTVVVVVAAVVVVVGAGARGGRGRRRVTPDLVPVGTTGARPSRARYPGSRVVGPGTIRPWWWVPGCEGGLRCALASPLPRTVPAAMRDALAGRVVRPRWRRPGRQVRPPGAPVDARCHLHRPRR